MNKEQFLAAIENQLKDMTPEEIKTSLDYYGEMLDDRMEEGMTEEEAVADMGSVDDITAQIFAEPALAERVAEMVREKIKPSRALKAWEIVLIVLGSPLWISLLAAAFSVALALAVSALAIYISVWSVIISLYAVDLSLAVAALGGIGGGIAALVSGKPMLGVLYIGCGLVCAGLAILLFFGANFAARGLAKGTANLFRAIFGKKNNK